jgi:hypothetical protein
MPPTSYQFTDKERLYFDRLQQEYQAGVSAGLRLIMTQQDLQGAWRVKADGSGLELPENDPRLAQNEAPLPDMERKAN